jgi:hypothetical protein
MAGCFLRNKYEALSVNDTHDPRVIISGVLRNYGELFMRDHLSDLDLDLETLAKYPAGTPFVFCICMFGCEIRMLPCLDTFPFFEEKYYETEWWRRHAYRSEDVSSKGSFNHSAILRIMYDGSELECTNVFNADMMLKNYLEDFYRALKLRSKGA